MRTARRRGLCLIAACVLGGLGWSAHAGGDNPYHDLRFPAEFVWGAAIADHQVDGPDHSDWDAFEHEVYEKGRFAHEAPGEAVPGNIYDFGSYPPDVRVRKTDFADHIDEDVGSASNMHLDALRFSISWSRLFPSPGMRSPDPAALAYYDRIFDALSERGIAPVVTLLHFTVPEWLMTPKDGRIGWERADAVPEFARFVRVVVDRYGDRVRTWCTLNEPMVYVLAAYMDGSFPPNEQRARFSDVRPIITALAKAHAEAYRIIHEDARGRGVDVRVGIAEHVRLFRGGRLLSPLDRTLASAAGRLFNWGFVDLLQSGTMRLPGGAIHLPEAAGTQDYLGLNYYGETYTRFRWPAQPPMSVSMKPRHPARGPRKRLVTDIGWSVYPEGLRSLLDEASQRYGLPIFIMENGIADSTNPDCRRECYLVKHLEEVWKAIHVDHVPVEGYFVWSLIDNFEWAEGFSQHFGLIAVDYRHGFSRTPRPSASLYGTIAGSDTVSAAFQARADDYQAAWKASPADPPAQCFGPGGS